jgi:DNA-directed RNA polymerase specialized sigma24 family protein
MCSPALRDSLVDGNDRGLLSHMDDVRDPASSEGLLRPAQFEGLLQRLDPDRERAGESYEKLRRKLIKFFEWNSGFPAEDLADETLDRVARKLTEEVVHDLSAFAAAVAKRVRQEAYKRVARRPLVSDLPDRETVLPDFKNPESILQDKTESERRARCLKVCMQRLADRDRQLFLTYHSEGGQRLQDRLDLAKKLGLTIGALRVRINRVRDNLEKCTRNCAALGLVRPSG